MNDTTIYRGIKKDNGKEIFGYYVQIKGKSFIIPIPVELEKPLSGFADYGIFSYEEVYPVSVSQNTGEIDKNEKEIYGSIKINGEMTEGGDTIIYSMSQTQHRKGNVYYDEGQWLIDVLWHKDEPMFKKDRGKGNDYEAEYSKGISIGRLGGKNNLSIVEVVKAEIRDKD